MTHLEKLGCVRIDLSTLENAVMTRFYEVSR
jgi:hypothetical protein